MSAEEAFTEPTHHVRSRVPWLGVPVVRARPVPDDNRTLGMVLGDPDKVALVIRGIREELVKQLNDAARGIEHSYGTVHEIALHTE